MADQEQQRQKDVSKLQGSDSKRPFPEKWVTYDFDGTLNTNFGRGEIGTLKERQVLIRILGQVVIQGKCILDSADKANQDLVLDAIERAKGLPFDESVRDE